MSTASSRPDRRRSDAQELHETAKDLRRALLTADGVGKVEIAGVQEERILVEVDQAQLAAMNIAPTRSPQRWAIPMPRWKPAASMPATSSCACASGRSILWSCARAVGRPGSAAGRAGRHRQLSRDYAERPQQIIRHNGQPALTLGISGVSGANIVEVGHSVEAVLQANEHRMPLGAELHPLYEQHRIVDESVNSFALNVFLSVAIVVGVLCIAMGLRAGVIIGAVLATVLGTLLVMWLAGIELERVSSAR